MLKTDLVTSAVISVAMAAENWSCDKATDFYIWLVEHEEHTTDDLAQFNSADIRALADLYKEYIRD